MCVHVKMGEGVWKWGCAFGDTHPGYTYIPWPIPANPGVGGGGGLKGGGGGVWKCYALYTYAS